MRKWIVVFIIGVFFSSLLLPAVASARAYNFHVPVKIDHDPRAFQAALGAFILDSGGNIVKSTAFYTSLNNGKFDGVLNVTLNIPDEDVPRAKRWRVKINYFAPGNVNLPPADPAKSTLVLEGQLPE